MGFNYAISDAANLTVIDKATSNILLYTPYANQTSLEFSSEQVYANAKGARAVRFDYNKQGTMTAEFEVFDLKWLSILLGGSWATGADTEWVREVLTVDGSQEATLTDAPTAGSLVIFLLEADLLAHGTEQTVGTPATNPDEYSIVTQTLTMNATSCPEGTQIVAYYYKASAATTEKFEIKFDDYPTSVEIIGQTMMARKDTGVTEYVEFNCPNAKAQGNATITMEAGGVTSLSAVFDLFQDENNNMCVIKNL